MSVWQFAVYSMHPYKARESGRGAVKIHDKNIFQSRKRTSNQC